MLLPLAPPQSVPLQAADRSLFRTPHATSRFSCLDLATRRRPGNLADRSSPRTDSRGKRLGFQLGGMCRCGHWPFLRQHDPDQVVRVCALRTLSRSGSPGYGLHRRSPAGDTAANCTVAIRSGVSLDRRVHAFRSEDFALIGVD